MPPFIRQASKKTGGVFEPSLAEKIQGGGGNVFDRLKRTIGAKAREALIQARENLLPNIPLYFPDNSTPGNGNGVSAEIIEEEKPSRMAPLIILSALGGFILLRIFR